MPTYVYEIMLPDGTPGERFEIIQSMSDPTLTTHPTTGQPVRQVLTAPSIAGKWSDLHGKSMLSNQNLERKGFTKYVRSGDGTYEKQVGQGPNVISAD